MTNILTATRLTKKFKKLTAVFNISFALKQGEILGFLGPNGAGKTTTIQMLLGVLTPTKGEIKYFNKNLKDFREEILEQINFSSTYTSFPWRLTVKENLNFISYLYNIKNRQDRLEKIYKLFKLDDIWNQEINQLSSGQLTRVNLAKSFINFPKVLLLDEPTASLDPETASYIRSFLLSERKKYCLSIIFTSHNMAEVEEVCDRVIFINHGKIIDDDTPENLSKTISVSHVKLFIKDGLKRAISYCKKNNCQFINDDRFITIDVKEYKIPSLLENLMKIGAIYTEISIEKPTLEDYFIQTAKK